jgi:hypothetical protein
MITKALLTFFALVLVIACFNSPAICGGTGGGTDEGHPWDEDGDRQGDMDPSDPYGDTLNYNDPSGADGNFYDPFSPGFLTDLHYIIILHTIPDFKPDEPIGDGATGSTAVK